MHEDDSAGGESLISPAGPSDDATPPARLRARPASWTRALLVYLVVAALAAAAGVVSTLAVQDATSDHAGASRTPSDAAADQPEAMNDETVYGKVEPGIVDVTSNLQYLQE